MAGVTPPPLSTFEWLKLIRDVRMPAAVKNVAAWVCSFGNTDGTRIYPGLDRLTLATGLSRDTAVQALAALRESGLLVRTKRGGGRGSRQSDEYQIGVPDVGSPEQLGKLVTAAYESARPIRKRKLPAPNESAEPTSNVQYESDLQTYESDLQTYESAEPTPPTRDHPGYQPGKTENTDAPRRDRDPSRSRPAIPDDWIRYVAEEQITELDADPAETATITGMVEAGAHPRAIRNKISADRFGPRATRTTAGKRCQPHNMPLAIDGSCNAGCAGSVPWAAP